LYLFCLFYNDYKRRYNKLFTIYLLDGPLPCKLFTIDLLDGPLPCKLFTIDLLEGPLPCKMMDDSINQKWAKYKHSSGTNFRFIPLLCLVFVCCLMTT